MTSVSTPTTATAASVALATIWYRSQTLTVSVSDATDAFGFIFGLVLVLHTAATVRRAVYVI